MGQSANRKTISVWVWLFLFALALPAFFYIGPIKFSSFRLVLIILFLPLFLKWLSGHAGKIILPDILICFFCIWSSLALFVNHRFGDVWQLAGSHTIETLGAYLLARLYIRTPAQFYQFTKALFYVMLVLVPVGLVETFTGILLLNKLVGLAFHTFEWSAYPPRLGMYRVQATFEHPIIFGVFCSSGFALFYYVFFSHKKPKQKYLAAVVSGFATFLSLSMGAYISVAWQGGLIVWERFMSSIKNSWKILTWLIVGSYIIIDLISNRNPIVVLISRLNFDSHTAYFRVHIWNFATDNVLDNPLFGIGHNEWVRPDWMPPSIDNFWLVNAVRYGLPGVIFIIAGFFIICRRIYRLNLVDETLRRYRYGFLFALSGIFISICTVHLWSSAYSYLLFLVGSGVWMIDYGKRDAKLRSVKAEELSKSSSKGLAVPE